MNLRTAIYLVSARVSFLPRAVRFHGSFRSVALWVSDPPSDWPVDRRAHRVGWRGYVVSGAVNSGGRLVPLASCTVRPAADCGVWCDPLAGHPCFMVHRSMDLSFQAEAERGGMYGWKGWRKEEWEEVKEVKETMEWRMNGRRLEQREGGKKREEWKRIRGGVESWIDGRLDGEREIEERTKR